MNLYHLPSIVADILSRKFQIRLSENLPIDFERKAPGQLTSNGKAEVIFLRYNSRYI